MSPAAIAVRGYNAEIDNKRVIDNKHVADGGWIDNCAVASDNAAARQLLPLRWAISPFRFHLRNIFPSIRIKAQDFCEFCLIRAHFYSKAAP